MNKNGKVKVCFAASSGGHLEQLMMLKPLFQKYDGFIITERTDYSVSVDGMEVYYLAQVNRKERSFIPRMLMNTMKSFSIYREKRPDVVVCTGVLAMIPMCLIVKAFGGKLIYIESFAKVTSGTMTGKFLYRFADQFYVQWKSMLKVYPKAIYKGAVY